MYGCFTPGMLVSHNVMPWHGVIAPDECGHWLDSYDGDVRVHWFDYGHDGWYSPSALSRFGVAA